MNVYVLFTQSVYDYEENSSVLVFSTIEKARHALKQFKNNARKEISNEIEEWEIQDENDYFCAYPDGYYSATRFVAQVDEREVI